MPNVKAHALHCPFCKVPTYNFSHYIMSNYIMSMKKNSKTTVWTLIVGKHLQGYLLTNFTIEEIMQQKISLISHQTMM